MNKLSLIILSAVTIAALGLTAYVAKKYASQKDALTLCEETLAKQKEQLAAKTTESWTLAKRVEQANRQQIEAMQRAAEVEKKLEEYQREKSKGGVESKGPLDKASAARQGDDDSLKKMEELTKKVSEFQEQENKYKSLITSLKNEVRSKEVTISQFQERLKIELVNQIIFGNGSTRITPTGQQVLSRVGAALKDLKENYIFVIGHTDSVPIGPDLLPFFPSNWELSSARSAAVVRYLVEKAGVDPARCVVVGRSLHSPRSTNETGEGRSQNRRAEIIIAKSLEFVSPDVNIDKTEPPGSDSPSKKAN